MLKVLIQIWSFFLVTFAIQKVKSFLLSADLMLLSRNRVTFSCTFPFGGHSISILSLQPTDGGFYPVLLHLFQAKKVNFYCPCHCYYFWFGNQPSTDQLWILHDLWSCAGKCHPHKQIHLATGVWICGTARGTDLSHTHPLCCQNRFQCHGNVFQCECK